MNAPADVWAMIEETVFRLFDDIAAPNPQGPSLIAGRLEELGWSEIEAEYPAHATALLFTAQGRSLVQTESLDAVIRVHLAPVLPDTVDAVVLGWNADGVVAIDERGEVTGVVVGPLDGPAGRLAVPVRRADGGVSLEVVDTGAVRSTRLDTFDRSVHWTAVTTPASTRGADVADQWAAALAAAQRALASELVALADQALALAAEHVTVRVQYGTPIGAMQSPRHALADASARLEGARALVLAAWAKGEPPLAMLAKAAAGRAHRAVSDAALQVCGAIGLTHEHRLHRFVSRGFQLDALCGSARQAAALLAETLFEQPSPEWPLPLEFV